MSVFLEKNLRALERVDKTLAQRMEGVRLIKPHEVIPARNGSPTLRIGNISLHSGYDPEKEADMVVHRFMEEFPDPGPILILGMGLGYHIEKLLDGGAWPCILIEPSVEVFRIALENMDLEKVLSKCQHILVDKSVDAVFAELDQRGVPLDERRLFVHQPSMKVAPEYFDDFLQRMKVQKILSGMKLNVLIVPPVYGGSLPIARYCASAFRRLGHRVTAIDNSIYGRALKGIDGITSNTFHETQLRNSLTQHLSERVMAKCLELKPDLVFALAQAPLTPDILDRMRRFGILTCFWFVEDYREFPYWKAVAGRYDHFFAIQKQEVFETPEEVNFHYLPLGCDPAVHRHLELGDSDRERFASDVSFVGSGYYNRRMFLQGLLGFDLKIWGTDWDLISPLARAVQENGRRVSVRETVTIFNGSKVNINLHSSTYHKGINPTGDFVNPRTFEIASCQGFQAVDPRSHLSELLEPNREIVCFEDIEDLKEKIAYYLSHPEERRDIAVQGQTRAHKDHTYRQRMAEVIRVVVEKHVSRFISREAEEWSPARLIDEAGPDTELGRFLHRFKRKDRLTLDVLVSEIQKGKGRLTEPEVIFLLMHEFSKLRREENRGLPH